MKAGNRLLLLLATWWAVTGGSRGLRGDWREEIRSHQDAVDRIQDYVLNGAGHHQAYTRLADFTDKYGPRVSASKALEDAIDGMVYTLTEEGFDKVAGESARAPDWRRGEEWAMLLTPRPQMFKILGLGSTVAGNVTAEVVVVKSFEALDALSNADVEGKIVVYNQGWVDYSHGFVYRNHGAKRAAVKGAVAALIRSVTQYSLYTPHTGQQNYANDVPAIPVACITVEDAELMQRLQDRGVKMEVQVYMDHTSKPDTTSRNLVAEFTGKDKPEETVIIGGHIDSWDVGMGVLDDAGGCIISWQALSILKALGLQPKRTIRLVMWTSEEEGLIGAADYYNAHKGEVNTTSLVMESDSGTFTPLGVGFTGSGMARAMLEETMSMLSSINASGVAPSGGSPDTGDWEDAGVPVGNLWNKNDDYFKYHHTQADTMTLMDADDLDLCSITWATAAYVVANLEEMLPREGEYPVSLAAIVANNIALLVMLPLMALIGVEY